jgi:hypothetical protein
MRHESRYITEKVAHCISMACVVKGTCHWKGNGRRRLSFPSLGVSQRRRDAHDNKHSSPLLVLISLVLSGLPCYWPYDLPVIRFTNTTNIIWISGFDRKNQLLASESLSPLFTSLSLLPHRQSRMMCCHLFPIDNHIHHSIGCWSLILLNNWLDTHLHDCLHVNINNNQNLLTDWLGILLSLLSNNNLLACWVSPLLLSPLIITSNGHPATLISVGDVQQP